MFRKSLLFGGLIAVLCLSGCSNANELPGYNAKSKHSSADFYKNDLMDSILNERIYNATSVAEVSDAARLLYRVDEMNAEQRRNLNYSISRAQYNAVTEIHMHTPEGGLSYTLPFTAFKRENIINGRWSTMKTKEKLSFVANDISFALPNEPNTQYVITLLVREDGERGIIA